MSALVHFTSTGYRTQFPFLYTIDCIYKEALSNNRRFKSFHKYYEPPVTLALLTPINKTLDDFLCLLHTHTRARIGYIQTHKTVCHLIGWLLLSTPRIMSVVLYNITISQAVN